MSVLGRLLLLVGMVVAAGCVSGGGKGLSPVRRDGPPPTFESAAERYDQRARLLHSIWAEAVVRIDYEDEDGGSRREQGEGALQIMQPDRLALSVDKVGAKRLFWFGCDAERYWWFDLIDRHVLTVGSHENFARRVRAGEGVRGGLSIAPLDLLCALGISDLSGDRGGTQWSDDGRWLGITTPTRSGLQRVWVDPETYLPAKIELYDADLRPALVADHSGTIPVEIEGYSGARPRVSSRITVYQPGSRVLLRLSLGSPQRTARRPSVRAFDLAELERMLGVDERVDADRAPGR